MSRIPRTLVAIALSVVASCLGGGPTGSEPGTCPHELYADPSGQSIGCTYLTGQLLRLDGTSIPYSSVYALYVLPAAHDSLRGTNTSYADAQGRFALSDVVLAWPFAGSATATPTVTNTPVTVRLYAKSAWVSTGPVDSLDVVVQFTIAGEKAPPTNIIWKTAKVR